MVEVHFERLSAMDLSLLAMENGRAHMHIGSVSLYDARPLRDAAGGLDFERVLSFTEAQLQKFPRFRQRLAWVPGFGQPVWVDDDRFDLRFHVRHTALPHPGDLRQLKRLAARILSRELDRAKPLWGYWIVDGVSGDRFAVISKLHHCMADGIAGVALGNLLVGPDPGYEAPPCAAWIPRPAPSGAQLVVAELRHRLAAPLGVLRAARRPAGPAGSTAPTARGFGRLIRSAFTRASTTPVNAEVGPHRRFDWTTLDFDEVHAIAEHAGGTVNDVALALVTGALRGFLGRRDVGIDGLDFRAVIPVSMRRASEASPTGNRVAELIAPLPLTETEPWPRLLRVVETTRSLKASGLSGASDLLGQVAELVPTQVLGPLFRLASRSSVANMTITNVPGPRVPVYLLGARQLETYPVVPLLARQGLGIALMSYDRRLFWGFNADRDAVPDLHELVADVEAGFAELRMIAPAP